MCLYMPFSVCPIHTHTRTHTPLHKSWTWADSKSRAKIKYLPAIMDAYKHSYKYIELLYLMKFNLNQFLRSRLVHTCQRINFFSLSFVGPFFCFLHHSMFHTPTLTKKRVNNNSNNNNKHTLIVFSGTMARVI